ncbi:O10AG protein, partial [Crocuta crocuta]
TEISNITTLVEFVLLGFSDIPNLHWVLFGIFLVIYLTILMCNSIIILITRIDSALQTPMYFFLSNFSFLEICYVTVTMPRMLMDLSTQKGTISFFACVAQMFFFLTFGSLECLLLTVMAYDRYVAICNPLHYPLIMNPRKCVQLVTISWVSDIPFVIGQTCQIFSLPFSEGNLTELIEFVLLDFADVPHLQWLLFGLFSIIYIIIVMSNGIIFLITKLDPALQTPMYYFLGNFSFLEICYVSVTLPRMLMNLCTQRRTISLVACATQMCCILVLGATECFLLAVMAYDRYMDICNPLHYLLVMNHKICVQLVAGSWISGIPVQIGQTFQIFSLSFCGSNLIDHFFCDIPPILKLACGDTFVSEMLVYTVAVLIVTIPFLLILISYSKIISMVLQLPSATSRAKAFSTCSSHL